MTKQDFAAHVTEWLEELPEDQHDWAESLLAGALDQTHGDLERALEMAQWAYGEENRERQAVIQDSQPYVDTSAAEKHPMEKVAVNQDAFLAQAREDMKRLLDGGNL